MLENNIAQPHQQAAFNKYTKILPACKSESNHYKTEETVILGQMEKFEKAKLKAKKKIKKFEKGDGSQAAKKSRLAVKRVTKKLITEKKN